MTCIRFVLAAAVLVGFLPALAPALEVWSGRTFVFSKPDSADWTLPVHQDRVTDAVWLTRAHTRGLFNIAQEDTYTVLVSPLDTEWASGNAADWQSLIFAPWQVWNGSYPPSMVGVDAVVHLISNDIYIDIRFESWTPGSAGGGFSYTRAEPPLVAVDEPVRAAAELSASPNPFNPATVLRFKLGSTQHANLSLYDSRGHLVRTLVNGVRPAGAHAVRWDGRDSAGRAAASGAYIARLRTDGVSSNTVLTLVK